MIHGRLWWLAWFGACLKWPPLERHVAALCKNDLQVILAMHTGQRGSINLSLISECRLYEGNNCWIRAKMHSCCGSALGLHATSPLVQSWEQLENTSHKQAYVATFQLDFLSLLEIISCCVPVCWLVEVGHSKIKEKKKKSRQTLQLICPSFYFHPNVVKTELFH